MNATCVACGFLMQHTVYLFDRFQLDVTRRKLLSAGGLVQPLNSRAMEALLELLANAGQVVGKKQLMQAVWPHTIVEDNNLNQCILAIRKALGETAGTNRFVMTVPGRGYCFVCPVRRKIQESDDLALAPVATNEAESQPSPGTAPPPALPVAGQAGRPARALPHFTREPTFWFGVATGLALATLLLLPLALL